jgi:ribonucleoside-diphosphate reductase alpha chain
MAPPPPDPSEKLTPSPIATRIWDMKYRLKAPDGTALDRTVEDTWRRVAKAAAEPEAPEAREHWTHRFYEAMDGFRFLPAGRILAGAGTGRTVTLFNCFVMGRIEDDMASIFQSLKEAALTMQRGGGVGFDFSTLRPKGAPVRGIGAVASGPLSFMDVWDAMCRTIMSAGHRRGAMMGTLSCSHPDIEDFIDAKRDPTRLRMFNLSVLVTDAFMEAVQKDLPWDLSFEGTVYKTVSARALFERIMHATYDYAEPGVVFIDRINRQNNLYYCETISATNPCGEQPLPPYGACLLGSINLARLVKHPFTDEAAIEESELAGLAEIAVRFLDNVIEISPFPLDAQRQEAQAKRRIGLGVTGLADALIMCRLRYGGSESRALTGRWLKTIERAAYLASTKLAAEKGAFPLFDADAYLAGETVKRLDADVRQAIAANGIRNGLLTSIAPTGTISLFADNVSSGIEPPFSFSYMRRVLLPDGSREEDEVEDYAFRLYKSLKGSEAALPDYFVSTQTISPDDHLLIEAAAQAHVDASISKTINVPEGISFDAFKDIYARAFALGLKGCTTYRPNKVTGAVLALGPALAKPPAPAPAPALVPPPPAEPVARLPVEVRREGEIVYMTEPLARPEVLPGRTYKLRWPETDHALYVTINDIIQDGRRRPFEIFINSKNMEHYAWTVALTRMISAVFRRGGDVSFVVDELKAVFDPRGGQWMEGHYVPSLLAAIGNIIEEHMVEIGFLAPSAVPALETSTEKPPLVLAVGAQPTIPLRACPRCFSPGVVRQENCDVCVVCGYSECA